MRQLQMKWALIAASSFSLATFFASGVLYSQTVSVASLQIPQKAWQHLAKAQFDAQHDRAADSERESRKALEIAPRFGEAYLLRATEDVRAHRYESAISNLLSAQCVKPGLKWINLVLAGAYNGMGRFNDASVVLANLHGVEAESWQAKYEQARTEIGQRNVTSALHWSALALASAPAWYNDVHLVRINALLLASQQTAAIEEMEAYLTSPEPQRRRAEVLSLLQKTRVEADAPAIISRSRPRPITSQPDASAKTLASVTPGPHEIH